MSGALSIEPDLKAGLQRLADATRRDQSDLANEAIRLYLEHETLMLEKIRTGLAQAERGEFASDADMETFFAEHAATTDR
jgi:predicted transcriptional regulator